MQQVGMAKSIKNDMWISKEDKLNPDMLPDLPGYHVLVRPVSIKEKTKGGILLPDSTRDDMAYGKHAGQKIQYKGIKYILLYDDQIIMKVESPKTLDPTFNLSKHSV
jgi:co-chaperonin GroES (HSP10)